MIKSRSSDCVSVGAAALAFMSMLVSVYCSWGVGRELRQIKSVMGEAAARMGVQGRPIKFGDYENEIDRLVEQAKQDKASK
jgi:hypothetical protein